MDNKTDSVVSNNNNNNNNKNFYGAIAMFLIVIGMVAALFFVEIPEKNNEVVKMTLGVLVGTLGSIMYSIMGKDKHDEEKKNLRIGFLETENQKLHDQVEGLQVMLNKLQFEIITKLANLQNAKIIEEDEK